MKISMQLVEAVEYPWDLLLLADPAREVIETYIKVSKVYVLTSLDAAIGVIVLTPLTEGVIEIKNIAIAPSYQRRGLGRQLLEYAIATCRAEDASEILIGTGNSSLGQLALYQKVGFHIVGVDPDFFTRNYPETIVENGVVCRDMIRLSYRIAARAEPSA